MNIHSKKPGPYLLVASVGTAITLVIIIGYHNLSHLASGTAGYTGAKLDAISTALEIDQKTQQIPEFIDNQTKIHVDSVKPIPPKMTDRGEPLRCESANHDGSEAAYFSVRVSHQWIFGIHYSSREYTVCGRANG